MTYYKLFKPQAEWPYSVPFLPLFYIRVIFVWPVCVSVRQRQARKDMPGWLWVWMYTRSWNRFLGNRLKTTVTRFRRSRDQDVTVLYDAELTILFIQIDVPCWERIPFVDILFKIRTSNDRYKLWVATVSNIWKSYFEFQWLIQWRISLMCILRFFNEKSFNLKESTLLILKVKLTLFKRIQV